MFSLIIFPEYFVRNAYQALLKNLNILKVILEKLHNIELISPLKKLGKLWFFFLSFRISFSLSSLFWILLIITEINVLH